LANVAHRLGGPDVNINEIPLVNGRGPAVQSQVLRPYPQFANVMQISPAWGNSTYHAMNLKFEKRYSAGLNLLGNFTWSKFIDDVPANSELGGADTSSSQNGYTSIYLAHLNKALSGNDIRRHLVLSAVYDLPFGSGRKFALSNKVAEAALGGWGIGIISDFRDGAPFGVIENTNQANTFAATQRPNLLAPLAITSNWRSNVLATPYFNTSVFQAPGPGIFGTAPRTICCGPGYGSIDLSAHKNWRLTERFRLQFRGDFYNLPNRPEFANPSLKEGLPSFGIINSVRSSSSGRLVQISMRLEF
jgi:hypothetical protein